MLAVRFRPCFRPHAFILYVLPNISSAGLLLPAMAQSEVPTVGTILRVPDLDAIKSLKPGDNVQDLET